MSEQLLVSVPLDGGETVYVSPIGPYLRLQIVEQIDKANPLPRIEDYETPYINSLGLPLYPPETDSPIFMVAKLRVLQKRANLLHEAIIDMGVVVDSPEGKAATTERFQPFIEKYQPGNPDDDLWLRIVKFCLITTEGDIQTIVRAASNRVTPEEIRAGVKSFRRKI